MEPHTRLCITQEVFVLLHPVIWPSVLMACTSYDSAPAPRVHCTWAEFEEQSKFDSTFSGGQGTVHMRERERERERAKKLERDKQ